MHGDTNARLSRLETELATARNAIAAFERHARIRRRIAIVVGAAFLSTAGWVAAAAPTMTAVQPPKDPLAKMRQDMAAMEKRLQYNIDMLQTRVKRLEDKPDNADNPDENKSGKSGERSGEQGRGNQGNGGGGNSGETSATPSWGPTQLLYNLVQRVTALENRNTVRAPFTVNDSQGSVLFSVTEQGFRGARVFDTGVARVSLEATSQGGKVAALAPDNGEAALSGVEKETEVYATGPNGGKAARIAGSSEGGVVAVGSQGGRMAVISAHKGPIGLRFYATTSEDKSLGGIGILNDGSTAVSLRSASGDQTVSLGSDSGHGHIQVFDKGTLRAEMEANAKGQVSVRNSTGNAVAFLTESSQGEGGNITLADPSGNGIVSAGYSASDQGDICLDRKQHLYCVGINLPLSMSH
jgi:hypothetical protein